MQLGKVLLRVNSVGCAGSRTDPTSCFIAMLQAQLQWRSLPLQRERKFPAAATCPASSSAVPEIISGGEPIVTNDRTEDPLQSIHAASSPRLILAHWGSDSHRITREIPCITKALVYPFQREVPSHLGFTKIAVLMLALMQLSFYTRLRAGLTGVFCFFVISFFALQEL